MVISDNINETKEILRDIRKKGLSIGFVPTMGYLHEGHLSLIRRAKEENDYVVLSIFVNPIQFGENEDLDIYPRDFEGDSQKAKGAGADFIFAPTVEEMYPANYKTYVDVKDITKGLCGATREGHFEGVTTVVTRLFNIVSPDHAYFGQKDAQQAVVITRMAKDLNMDVKIVVCDIMREPDGLAMSSRNINLQKQARAEAVYLSKSLFAARDAIENGEKSAAKIIEGISKMIQDNTQSELEYVSVVDNTTLKDIDVIQGEILIAIATRFGATRLIDNIKIRV